MAERFGEADGFALATHAQGYMLIKAGRVAEGLALLDESMLAATRGDLSPMVTGIVYCGVILACQEVFEARRAQEWTAALTEWCEGQPDVVAFTGRCLVHRAEILQLGGAWLGCARGGAEGEAALHRRGEPRTRRPGALPGGRAPAAPRRLRGGRAGLPRGQPYGLGPAAGPRAAQARAGPSGRGGCVDSTRARRDRRAAETSGTAPRVRRDHARSGRRRRCGRRLSRARGARASASRARCSARWSLTRAARCTSRKAIRAQRSGRCVRPLDVWQELDAPYEVARTRELIGLACRALGDDEAATLELEAARAAFEELRAAPDAARVAALTAPAAHATARALGPRARGAPSRGGRAVEPRDRGRARHQRAHGRAAPAEHLREARRLVPHGRRLVRLRARARLIPTPRWSEMTTSSALASWLLPAMNPWPPRPTVAVSTKGAGDGDGRARGDADHRRGAGRPCRRLPPEVEEARLRHPRRERAHRRLVAQALAFASAVLAGELRRASGHGVSGPGPLLSDRSRDGRLPRVLRRAVRATRPIRDHRRRAGEERRRIHRDRRRSSARRGQRGRRDGCVPARAPDRSRVRVRARSRDSAAPLRRLPRPGATAARAGARGRRGALGRRHRVRGCARGLPDGSLRTGYRPDSGPPREPTDARWPGPYCASCGRGS